MTEMPGEIIDHYRSADEDSRLTEGMGLLELLRTQEIIRRHLPQGSQRIADVGGATGVHASWLAQDGHEVEIFDVVPEHIEAAKRLTATFPAVSATLGDARRLPCSTDSVDAVLLFGPLYHLTAREDRLLALQEAARVARPGGLIFAAAISRFASLFDGLRRGFIFDAAGTRMVEEDLATGQHRNPLSDPEWFTTAYFHRPDDLRRECLDADLEVLTVVGVEGIVPWLPHLAERWEIPSDREVILRSAAVVEAEDSLLGVSPHLIAVARIQ